MRVRVLAEEKNITTKSVQDDLFELIQNNSNIEGEKDDSLVFTGVKNVNKSGSDRIFIDFEDGTEVQVSVRVRKNGRLEDE